MDEDGNVRCFFELNGQPRTVKIPNRAAAAKHPARRKADEADAGHVPAPMPGVVSTIAVREGQTVAAGDVLLSIEAMKMETQVYAPRDGTIRAVHVTPGAAVEPKDLLAEIG